MSPRRYKEREAAAGLTHAHMQVDRLGFAMRVAAKAMDKGDIRAIAPFIKAVGELDGYQAMARELAPAASPQERSEADRVVLAELRRRFGSPPARHETAPPAPVSSAHDEAPPAAAPAAAEPTVPPAAPVSPSPPAAHQVSFGFRGH